MQDEQIPRLTDPVQLTSDDAAISKASASIAGYFDDPFVARMVSHRSPKRAPLIHRGYYARHKIFDETVDEFFEACSSEQTCQLVVLGSGGDTQLLRRSRSGTFPSNAVVFEMDLVEVIERKTLFYEKDPLFKKYANPVRNRLNLVATDLRDTQRFLNDLTGAGASLNAPTLFLSECVLVYLESADSFNVLKTIASHFSKAKVAIYEQINPYDAFGTVMRNHLAKRGCPLLSVEAHPTLDAFEKLLTNAGFKRSKALTMSDVYQREIDQNDRQRIEKLEIFDEFEEWNLFSNHYAFATATTTTTT